MAAAPRFAVASNASMNRTTSCPCTLSAISSFAVMSFFSNHDNLLTGSVGQIRDKFANAPLYIALPIFYAGLCFFTGVVISLRTANNFKKFLVASIAATVMIASTPGVNFSPASSILTAISFIAGRSVVGAILNFAGFNLGRVLSNTQSRRSLFLTAGLVGITNFILAVSRGEAAISVALSMMTGTLASMSLDSLVNFERNSNAPLAQHFNGAVRGVVAMLRQGHRAFSVGEHPRSE